MPRKVAYGVDYDDNYDEYEYYDEDYDYYYEVEEIGTAAETMPKKETSQTGLWRCPICTYDNEDSMSACDTCGVWRNPLVKVNTQSHNSEGITSHSKNPGVSVMAKSLFASSPQQVAKASVLPEVQNNYLNLHRLGKTHGTIPEVNSAFNTRNHQKVNIDRNRF